MCPAYLRPPGEIVLYWSTSLAHQNVRLAWAFGRVSWSFDGAGYLYSRTSADSNTSINSVVQLAYQKCNSIQEHLKTYFSFPCPSGFLLWDLAVVRISPVWVTTPEQSKSNNRNATFSLWKGMFWVAFTPLPLKQLHRCDSVFMVSFVEIRYTTRRWSLL